MSPDTGVDLGRFDEHGYAGPIRVFPARTARRLLRQLSRREDRAPLAWLKGCAATSRAYYALACHPTILSHVTAVLGEDCLLWGAMLARRHPGMTHAWHTDMECAGPTGRTVSVWLALENCRPGSSLEVVRGSHRFGTTVQEMRARDQIDREHSGNDDLVRWARQFEPDSAIETVATADGEMVIFDGHLWHGTDNSTHLTRTAVLLQYATTETPIRIPVSYDGAYDVLETPKPPCVIVSGRDQHHVNRVVPGPPTPGPEGHAQLTVHAQQLNLPLPLGGHDWAPHSIFAGKTAGLHSLTCHASVLVPGHSPHMPHRHDDEELLMVLDGVAEVELPDLPEAERRQQLTAGECVYYPANFAHTIHGGGDAPVHYLMLKWIGDPAASEPAMPFSRFKFESADDQNGGDSARAGAGFETRVLLDAPTQWLHKLHCHTSTMQPGAGYEPHADAYDVVMILLEGELESIGDTLSPHGVYFYAAGELHGARNTTAAPARYVVFEFHGQPSAVAELPKASSILRKYTDPARYWRRLRKLARRFRR